MPVQTLDPSTRSCYRVTAKQINVAGRLEAVSPKGTPKVLPRKTPLATRQIPDTHRIPADWILRLPLDHLMREYEELGMEVR
jgi:hypothetical protein